ncbi:MAG TPA: sulfite exporter TauE/SafE family protein [Mycobacteriales bacterium]|nr:sulfite exporter TauE/SafE family protein [Mycobacteriales bacterium]
MIALAIAFGLAIGVALGALGGGGSILTVPALVYALGQSARAATAGSLVIVGIAAIAGTAGHARAGRVRWRAGTGFGVAGVAASFAGAWANRAVNPNVLLLAFAGLMLVAAAGMLRRSGRASSPAAVAGAEPGAAGPTGRVPVRADGGVRQDRRTHARPSTAATIARVVGAGLVVGFLTGFFGVGGGFVIVPGLIFSLGYRMPEAVATSLLVIAINSAAALLARVGHVTFNWAVIVPFTLAAVAGSVGGKRISEWLSATMLTRAFVGLLLAVAGYVAARSIAGLA